MGGIDKAVQQKMVARTLVNVNSVPNSGRNGILVLLSNVDKVLPIKLSKKLSGQEVDERRRKGLCFWCREKFVPSHKCSRRHKLGK